MVIAMVVSKAITMVIVMASSKAKSKVVLKALMMVFVMASSKAK